MQQITISGIDLAKLIVKQVGRAFAAREARNTQSPRYKRPDERQDTIISSIKPLTTQQTRYRDGPMRNTDAQELSDGQNPTFEAWRLQILARFRDDPGWYQNEERKLDYMLRHTTGNAQTHMISGMKDRLLPGFFETA